jgi:hypothetical protein
MVDRAVHSLSPKKAGDWAVTMINNHRKRKGDLFFSDLVTEKDASAWAFQIIGHLHSEPDHKFAHDINKLPLLCLKMPTRSERGHEKSRHEKLMGGDQCSKRPPGEDEKIQTDKDNKDEKIQTDKDDKNNDADEESEENSGSREEERIEKSQIVFDFDSDKLIDQSFHCCLRSQQSKLLESVLTFLLVSDCPLVQIPTQ